jgi:hypothetical protein
VVAVPVAGTIERWRLQDTAAAQCSTFNVQHAAMWVSLIMRQCGHTPLVESGATTERMVFQNNPETMRDYSNFAGPDLVNLIVDVSLDVVLDEE